MTVLKAFKVIILCKSVEILLISLYFSEKMGNMCSDLMCACSIHGNEVKTVCTIIVSLKVHI